MRYDGVVLFAALLVSGPKSAQGAPLSAQDQAAIVKFAQEAAVQALDYTQGDRQSLMDAQPNFTAEGWSEFMKRMSGWLDDTGAPTGSSSFTPTGDAVVEGQANGVIHLTILGTLKQSQNSSSTTYPVVVEVWVGGNPEKIRHLEPTIHMERATSRLFGSGERFGDTMLSPSEKQFLDSYIAATRSGDPNKIKALIHPNIVACMSPENNDYYDTVLGKLAHLPVPERYEVNMEPVDPDMMQKRVAFFWGPDSSLPVMPTREITVQYMQKDDSQRKGCKKFVVTNKDEVIHTLDLVESDGEISMVVGCIGPKTLENFRQKPKRETEAAERATSLLREMSPELKARLTNLITTGQTISAIKAYQAESKQTLTDSVNVLDQICDEL